MSSINFAGYVNTEKNSVEKQYLQFSFNSHFFVFTSMKPPLAGTRCMDQSKAFCPRNFEETVSKIQQMRSKTSQWFSFLVLVRVTMVLWVVLGWNVRMGVEFACGTWTGPCKRSRAVIAWICLSIERVFIILNEF